ncbi:2-C-methyl-D-erythritol 4-phosphate cytidylyltransferase [Staphylococcus canis]|uniref:2-C-methyl-D-erythritol 4-phosphate cytidylyltransferase n=1 Tax=Staphylococcus canis TaxID=2724942 RepID=A0ABS0TD15_9STAP|nr:2-C-methyl-D-erythritol 4-phosphate cytidylyltransferase [Staphylococcus canis]MBI5975628.1 2-C-methyl-D-erythritol 4-phosphate cytidylyltransferase [Staphylococcus canis]
MAKYHVIIPAAGKGTRMGRTYNKLLIELNDSTILERTIEIFENDSSCEGIHLAIHPRDRETFTTQLEGYSKVKSLVDGGAERQESIHNVLRALSLEDDDIVIVHDGARPFVNQEDVHRLVNTIEQKNAAILGVKAKDTVKVVRDGYVDQTLNRQYVWLVHTPQGSTFKTIKSAYDLALQQDFHGTDDASLLEYAGHAVAMVEGHYDNIKVTTEEDLVYARAMLKERGDV